MPAYVIRSTYRPEVPAILAVQDRGMAAIIRDAGDPSAALDTLMADTFGRAIEDPSN
jgi:hypothetical protein